MNTFSAQNLDSAPKLCEQEKGATKIYEIILRQLTGCQSSEFVEIPLRERSQFSLQFVRSFQQGIKLCSYYSIRRRRFLPAISECGQERTHSPDKKWSANKTGGIARNTRTTN